MNNVLLVILIALVPLAIIAGATVLVRRNRKDLYYREQAAERARAAQAARAESDQDGSAGV